MQLLLLVFLLLYYALLLLMLAGCKSGPKTERSTQRTYLANRPLDRPAVLWRQDFYALPIRMIIDRRPAVVSQVSIDRRVDSTSLGQ